MERSESLQALVDALSLALKRPVLLDDAELRPLAYSSQWGEIDAVRSESIMRRGAKPEVRRALQRQGIAEAQGVVRTQPEPAIAMEERVCAPVRCGGRVLGYLWLLDAHHELDDEQLERVGATARRAAQVLDAPARRPADEAELVARLCSGAAQEQDAAAEEVRSRRLLPDRPLVVCVVAALAGADAFAAAVRMAARLSPGHALLGSAGDEVALLVALEDPVVAVLDEDEVAGWLLGAVDGEALVGQSGSLAGLADVPEGWSQALVALRVARARAGGAAAPGASAAWPDLGAERLLARLPASAARDVPPALARLLREEPVLAETLAAFLDAAGDVKATATALNLHRSGLYYRLHRVEELTGLRLDDGDDRLLAHMALRLARLG